MNFDANNPQNKAVIEFLLKRKMLVVSASATVRANLKSLLKVLGLENSHVELSSDFETAWQKFMRFKPEMIITDYFIKDKVGIDLITLLKQEHPGPLNTLTCLIADQSYPGLSAKALELEVDVFVVRPFSIEKFSQEILDQIIKKINAEKSQALYDEGKKRFAKNLYQEATHFFLEAIGEGIESANSFYFLYECSLAQKKPAEALSYLEKGLKFDEKNYLCLKALFYHYYREQKINQAYIYLTRLLEEYPLDPHMIPDFTKVLIANQKHDDIIKYCDLLTSWGNLDQLENQRDKMSEEQGSVPMKIRSEMAATLVVAIRYLWQNGKKINYEEILYKALRLSDNTPKIVSGVAKMFFEMNKTEECRKILLKISADEWPHEAHVTDFFLDVAQNRRAEEILFKGMMLTQKGIHDRKIYEVLIRKSVELNRSQSAIEKIYLEAETHFPEHASFFKNLFKKAAKKLP